MAADVRGEIEAGVVTNEPLSFAIPRMARSLAATLAAR